MLGAHGHGQRRLPSLEAALHNRIGLSDAAPYVNHVSLAAPYLSATPPILLGGLLVPDICSPKPPCARKKPTRTNLFKASRTLSLTSDCGGCPVSNGTVIVAHLGSVPPIVYLCSTTKAGDSEVLVPYDTIAYQVAANSQFTLATNAAFSLTTEITSFAAARPLNGLATAAHVMDIDDIETYSTGTYELRSTTPKDSINSVSLAKGLVAIMGPESFTETLIHPVHGFNKTYPGYTFMAQATEIPGNTAYFYFRDIIPHRWFVNTTFEVWANIQWDHAIDQQYINLGGIIINGQCPITNLTGVCKPVTLKEELIVYAKRAYSGLSKVSGDKNKPDGTNDPKQPTTSTTRRTRSAAPTPDDDAMADPVEDTGNLDDLNEDTVCFTFTTNSTQNCTGIFIDANHFGNNPARLKKASITVRTLVQDPEHQFGPAAMIRLQGLTQDIIIQANVRAAVSGIQTGESRSVAPPTAPSRLATGEEDAILAQALFDDPATPIARIMTTSQFAAAAAGHENMTSSNAAAIMEAAPIGDTIRNIAGTLSNIGHGLGGPFSTIGDVIGTVGNIAGGIGDTIGKIFSAPSKRPRITCTPPDPVASLTTIAPGEVTISQPVVVKDIEPTTPEAVKRDMIAKAGWSVRLNNPIMARLVPPTDGMHPFPWVASDQSSSGLANIYVTQKPLQLKGRSTAYVRVTLSRAALAFNIDSRLVTDNNMKYVAEVVNAIAYCERGGWYVTTDAPEPVFGDSMAAAVVAACIMPSERVAVTGGFAYTGAGNAALSPVGELERKLLTCTEEGYILVAPDTTAARNLRATIADSPIVTCGDIMMGNLISSPQCILAGSMVEMIYALSFANASISTPIGEQEAEAKQAAIREAETRGAPKLSEMERYRLDDKTPEEQQAIVETLFRVDIPGFGAEDLPIMDIDWWRRQPKFLSTSTDRKGMGISLEKILRYINTGMTYKLKGIAMSVRSRVLSEARRTKTGQPAPPKTGRVPMFKRRDLGAMRALIERARTGTKRPAEPQQEGAGPSRRTEQMEQ